VEFVGVVVGSDNPARSKNSAVRLGANSASAGERCAGDAYAGCAAESGGVNARYVRTSKATWGGEQVIVRVILRARNIDGVVDKVLKSLGPEACVIDKSAYPSMGVVEKAAEDMTTMSTSTFLGYAKSKAATTIEMVPGEFSLAGFRVRALRLDLPEGCGVIRL